MTSTHPNNEFIATLFPSDDAIDPVAAVTTLLERAGHPNPVAWQDGLAPEAFDQDLTKEVRRFHVNRQWRTLLGMLEEDTTNARFCLVDQGGLYGWLVLFNTEIVPLAVKYKLPNLTW